MKYNKKLRYLLKHNGVKGKGNNATLIQAYGKIILEIERGGIRSGNTENRKR